MQCLGIIAQAVYKDQGCRLRRVVRRRGGLEDNGLLAACHGGAWAVHDTMCERRAGWIWSLVWRVQEAIPGVACIYPARSAGGVNVFPERVET
jgi:hypothetical protein